MKNIDIVTPILSAEYTELSDERRQLVDAARAATARSYAPYSKFCVGAAIRLDNGVIIEGSNQENAAFPSGTCAERTAAFYAHSRHPEAKFQAIAIAACGTDGREVANPIPPCGACRQSLLEFETLAGRGVEVILVGRNAIYIIPSIGSLLPISFTEF